MGRDRSTTRFETLDLLRGLAALGVLAYHLGYGLVRGLCPHGYLAVDMFYVLSGFVVAHAFGERLRTGRMSAATFVRQRLARLMPTIMAGTLLGATLTALRQSYTAQDTATLLLAGLAMIPALWAPPSADVFPLNGPAWSLFSELAANLAWVGAQRPGGTPAGTRAIGAAVAITGAIGIVYGCWHIGCGAFGPTSDTFGIGLSRVAYGFPIGVMIRGWHDRVPRVGATVPLVGLALLIAVPDLGAWTPGWDAACMLVLSPCVVALASGARLGPRGRRLASVSAAVSYPLYAVHGPIVDEVSFVVGSHASGTWAHAAAAGGVVATSLALAAVLARSGAKAKGDRVQLGIVGG